MEQFLQFMAILDKGKNSAYFSGLDSVKVEHSRKRFGANILTPPKKRPLWKLYLEKYNDPLIKILLAAAVLSLILSLFGDGLIETLGILIAIFLATTVGFVFEIDAAKKFNILTSFNEDSPVKVRRNETVTLIPRKDVVVGDIVLLEAGDEIPADGDLLEAINLEVNESSLTGEQMTAKSILSDLQQTDAAARTYSTYPENRVYRSTMVMNGRGVMRVTEVGDNTEIGHTASKSMEETDVDTPLNNQLKRLAKLISRWGMAISILAFVVLTIHDFIINNYWQGYTLLTSTQTILKYFMVAVTLIVMAVPEGLPMAITLSLALNMRRMLKSNNLVRKLHACETMGAATVICTDKTGTLTQNKMKVQEVVKVIDDDELLAYAIAANTTAELDDHAGGIGNPTEVALLNWVQSLGYDYRHLRQHSEMVSQLPFSTERKYMQTEVDILGHRHVFTKGAPEIIIQSCGESNEKLSDAINQLEDFQHRAMRTLALAADGRLQAIFAISDPLRDDVPEAVRQCQNAGIEIKIVTGDVSATAIEIARQIGMWDDSTLDECHITGTDFAVLNDDEAFERAQKIKVMSRARPNDKQRLVQMLQKAGEVVAVTGDGTNDAPALNYAHVGLSLGSGTNVAKEASDMTLLDDSFNSIVRAVMWGRSLYRNLQRFIFFQLTVNVVALTLSLLGSIVGQDLPLTVTQILWINLIMDTLAALALSSLPPSEDVMTEKPRKQTDSIINRNMLIKIAAIGTLMSVVLMAILINIEKSNSVSLHELTIFFTVFVMLQFWNLFNAKCLNSASSAFHCNIHDSGMILVMLIILVCQWLIVTFGGEVFRTEPLLWSEWLLIIACTSPMLLLGFWCKKI